ncbi:hypothetical protein M409DRAFT_57014 [Zasmidium cellare ATCC 36951]|uniref:Uncharacterized protein n=1 Tax=Zasmidium cellare ATCC 36951 TaxID=1080233 RepID=A0A6A6CAS4_ZASCE|nr:uncharacterized protein M409DRAFT_57014 [Zasmidium cellare ATCC 36951]KAF2163903.1 hypothetical protein M409DRAFT_57014 [Zasmidium cellare ATCC 36951]
MAGSHSFDLDFENMLKDVREPAVQELIEDQKKVRETSRGLTESLSLRSKHEAVVSQNPEWLRMLLQRDPELSENIVAEAFQHKDKECIRAFLDFGWDINTSIWAFSPLCFAVDDKDFMRWLIDQGADINALNSLGQPVLAKAIASGDFQVVSFLLVEGADLMLGDLLHSAVERKNEREGAELVEFLASKGPDVNALRYTNPTASRQMAMSFLPTPLYLAVERENIPVARALLRHGADPARRVLCQGHKGQSALERVRSINNPEISALFRGTPSKI